MPSSKRNPLDKAAVLKRILERLREDASLYYRAARAAQFEATDEQSRAENKYDTRGLEASYLARGQSRQAAEAEQALAQFQALADRRFAATDPIDLGGLVELRDGRQRHVYFVGPSMGGTEVEIDGTEVLVVTPHSPLGQQLIGKKVGDHLRLPAGDECRIASLT